jgi:hypothetical protein
MATSIEDLQKTMNTMANQLAGVQDMAKQFAGFQDALATVLDKLNDLQSWRTITETSLGSMMQQSKETTNRVLQLEARPPPPPPPQTFLPPPHQGAPPPQQMIPQGAPPRFQAPSSGIDLNIAPALASSSQSPHGHGQRMDHRDVGVGVYRSPPHPVTGMPPIYPPLPIPSHDGECIWPHHSAPAPKMEFPKFDGDNPVFGVIAVCSISRCTGLIR